MLSQIETENTKFHGATYDEEIDRPRLTGQLERLANCLLESEGQWLTATQLCYLADVSYSALRNRISDLRVYHGLIIASERAQDGLWQYRYEGKMEPYQHFMYLASLRASKPIGDSEKWGEMWRSIYAYAHTRDLINRHAMQMASEAWAEDMTNRVTQRNNRRKS